MIQNMRDLGGTRTRDGRVIQPGLLVRSAALSRAVPEDLRGVSTVIDLRTPAERQEAPDLPCGCEYLALPVFEEMTAGVSHERGADDLGLPDMAVIYGRLMRECAPAFRVILQAIMAHDFRTGAVLWHCTEGKDRCGMTSALVLEALGVDRETILADYLKTNLVNVPKGEKLRAQLIPARGEAFAERVYQIMIADERYLRAAWEAMGQDYLHGALQLDESVLEAFRDTVLERP